MSYSSDGIISAPVSIRDVLKVLKESSSDLGIISENDVEIWMDATIANDLTIGSNLTVGSNTIIKRKINNVQKTYYLDMNAVITAETLTENL